MNRLLRRGRAALLALHLACAGAGLTVVTATGQSVTQANAEQQTNASDQAPEDIGDGWITMAPSKAGFDPARLAQLTSSIARGDIHNVHAVLVEHAGALIYERYFSGPDQRWGASIDPAPFDRHSLHDLRSVTKSVVTAVLGIALAGQHEAALARPVTEFFPHLAGRFSPGTQDVTLKHVLTMTAGFEWNEMEVPYTDATNDEVRLDRTPDPVAMVLARPIRSPPGEAWYYNGGLAQVAAAVIERETGMSVHDYTRQALFEPLGITRYEWLGSGAWDPPAPSAASGLRMTARGLAKIGSVFLHRGKWHGKQIIPEAWVDLSTRHHVKEISWGRSTGVYGYGFMWYPGRTNDEAGHRLIRAAGNGNQRIFILPDLGLNIVVYAGNYNDYSFKSDAKVLDAVMAARAD